MQLFPAIACIRDDMCVTLCLIRVLPDYSCLLFAKAIYKAQSTSNCVMDHKTFELNHSEWRIGFKHVWNTFIYIWFLLLKIHKFKIIKLFFFSEGSRNSLQKWELEQGCYFRLLWPADEFIFLVWFGSLVWLYVDVLFLQYTSCISFL